MTDQTLSATTDATDRRRYFEAQQRRRKLQRIVLGVGFPLALVVAWELASLAGLTDKRFFPAPTRIVEVIAGLLASPDERSQYFIDILATLRRLAIGFTAGALLGVGTGLAMGLSTWLRYAISPLLSATYPTPKLALFPLFIVIFGLGEMSLVAIVILTVFYTTAITALTGVTYSNPIYRDVGKAFRLPHRVMWLQVVIPAALPSIVNGLKIGIGQALILVVAVEMVSSETGIGHFIWNSWEVFDIGRMFLGVCSAVALGGGAMLLGEFLEHRLTPWVRRDH